jgi:hypothetical protein
MCTVQGRRGIDSHRADLRHVEHREQPALTPKGSRGWENGRATQRSFLARLGRVITGWDASSRARVAVGYGQGCAPGHSTAPGKSPHAPTAYGDTLAGHRGVRVAAVVLSTLIHRFRTTRRWHGTRMAAVVGRSTITSLMVAVPANIRERRSSLSLLASYIQIGFRDGWTRLARECPTRSRSLQDLRSRSRCRWHERSSTNA